MRRGQASLGGSTRITTEHGFRGGYRSSLTTRDGVALVAAFRSRRKDTPPCCTATPSVPGTTHHARRRGKLAEESRPRRRPGGRQESRHHHIRVKHGALHRKSGSSLAAKKRLAASRNAWRDGVQSRCRRCLWRLFVASCGWNRDASVAPAFSIAGGTRRTQ